MKRSLFASFILIIQACLISLAHASELSDLLSQFRRPTEIPFPASNPYTRTKATLGKMLFYDQRVSQSQNMSCVSCHNPSFGWEVPFATAIGAQNLPLARHAPATFNLAWQDRFFWDGRATTLEEQAAGPITAHDEMNMPLDLLVRRIRSIAKYRDWFELAFPGEGVTAENILKTIATYERTIVTDHSPFDQWVDGDDDSVSESVKRGFAIFVGKAQCARCHAGWNFTDNGFHDVGIMTDDIGRASIDRNEASAYAFKTPSLRNLTKRAPYMHNGALADIDSVIDHYSSGGVRRDTGTNTLQPFQLSADERRDLVAFLGSLDSRTTDTSAPDLPY